MNRSPYEEEVEVPVLSPATPAVVWGALMAVALLGAGATIIRSHQVAKEERLVSTSNDASLQRDVAQLVAERDALAGRLASLERSFGEMKLASRASSGPETTGSVGRSRTAAWTEGGRAEAKGFGLMLGPDASYEAIRRRWTALSARYPQQLGKLSPRAQRSVEAPNVFDLVTGPFATRAEADRACAALADEGLACDTTVYAGDPIGRP